MELWASCDPCDRWFFVPFELLEDLSRVVCPSCGAATNTFEARADNMTFTVDVPAVVGRGDVAGVA